MPKIVTNVKDESGLSRKSTYTVLITGLYGMQENTINKTMRPITAQSGDIVAEKTPTLITNVDDLEKYFGKVTVATKLDGGKIVTDTDVPLRRALVMAEALLKLGMNVIYVGYFEAPSEIDWSSLIGSRSDKELRFVCSGDFPGVNELDKIKACATYGGCSALSDIAETITPTRGQTIAEAIQSTFAGYINYGNPSTQLSDDIACYGAGFAPWGKYDNTIVADDFVDTYFPASFAYLLSFANSVIVNNNPVGFAVAGKERGLIPGYVQSKYTFDDADINVLQRKTSDITSLDDIEGVAVNPICFIRTIGNVVWGNRTLKPNTTDTKITSKLTWSSFLNIMQVVLTITDTAWLTSKEFTFEQNTDVLWVNYRARLSRTLDRLQSDFEIADYRIDKLPTKDRARLCTQITIVPIEPVEDFKINVNLSDSISVSVEQ